jgi:hypothetical protein
MVVLVAEDKRQRMSVENEINTIEIRPYHSLRRCLLKQHARSPDVVRDLVILEHPL